MMRIVAELTGMSTFACPPKADSRGSFQQYWKYDSVDVATQLRDEEGGEIQIAGVVNPPADTAPAIHHVDVPG